MSEDRDQLPLAEVIRRLEKDVDDIKHRLGEVLHRTYADQGRFEGFKKNVIAKLDSIKSDVYQRVAGERLASDVKTVFVEDVVFIGLLSMLKVLGADLGDATTIKINDYKFVNLSYLKGSKKQKARFAERVRARLEEENNE